MMNLKYYLRGLGIGIIVTALIMSIAAGGKETLSNEEIKERAIALGMVEEGTLLEDAQAALNTLENSETEDKVEEPQNPKENGTPEEVPEQSETPEPKGTPEPEEAPKQSENEASEEVPEQSENEALEEVPEQSETPKPEETPEPEVIVETEGIWQPDEDRTDEESVTVQVMRGDGSYTVCKRLEEAGIIASASEFDTFLCQNGYDKKIRAGTFEIPGNADPEQIARILSGT